MLADHRRAALALLAFVLGACGASACTSELGPSDISLLDAFATPGQDAVAVYLTLSNGGDADQIIAAAVTGNRSADRVTLHQTEDRNGLSVMVPTRRIDVPGGRTTSLDPGEAHLMIEGLDDPIDVGDTFTLRIETARAEPMDATVEVIATQDALDRINEALETGG